MQSSFKSSGGKVYADFCSHILDNFEKEFKNH